MSLSIFRVISLVILVGLLFLLGIVFILLGGWNLNILDHPTKFFSSEQSASLTVSVIPHKSEVVVDSIIVGESPLNISIKPGKHRIQIRSSGYTPYEETLVLQPNQQIVIEYHLRFNPHISTVSDIAAYPLWIEENTLLYFDLTDRVITEYLADGTKNNIKELQGNVTSMNLCTPSHVIVEYLPDNNPGIAIQNVISINMITNEEVYLGIGHVATLTLSDKCNAYLLGWYADANADNFSFWIGNPNEKLQEKSLPMVSEILPPESFNISSDHNWLDIEGSSGTAFWQYDGNAYNYAFFVDKAYGTTWSPLDAKATYIDINGSIHMIELPSQSDKIISLFPGSLPLRWTPKGNQIVFSTYNPTNGGSSFWAVDVNNNTRTLLADSSLILGRVTDFAISPDGSRIAYINDLNHLNILFVGK